MDNIAYKTEEELSREAPPAYSSISTTSGLEQLSTLSRVDVRQKNVTTEHGEVIFGLKREYIRKGCSYKFYFDLYEKTGKLVATLDPVSACCSPYFKIIIEGQYAAQLKLVSVLGFCPRYVVSDAVTKQKILKIHPHSVSQRFLLKLKDMEGNEIGSITKRWNGLAEEIFSDANELQMDFPKDLGVQYKLAVIAFCLVMIQEANVQYRR